MLEKDKKCIEFSMRSMMLTHRPYQEDTEIEITGMAPGKSLLWANNPFDIPCDVVVVPKKDFERLQASNQYYCEMTKQFEEGNEALLKRCNKLFSDLEYWRSITGFSAPDQVQSRIKSLENAVRQTDRTMLSELKSNIDDWQKATGCSTPEEAEKKIKSYLYLLAILMFK